MTRPYTYRILARYGSELMELKRFHRPLQEADIKFWTEGVQDWEIERTLADHECLSSRPEIMPYHVRRATVKLTPEEREALTLRGWEAEYKVST